MNALKSMSAQHTPARFCDVMAALDARRTAQILRRAGHEQHATAAWSLVQSHLRRAAIAKATEGAK